MREEERGRHLGAGKIWPSETLFLRENDKESKFQGFDKKRKGARYGVGGTGELQGEVGKKGKIPFSTALRQSGS